MIRHTCRRASGVSLTPGVNLVEALEALCIYEDLCALAECEGPDELENLLGNLRTNVPKRTREAWKTTIPQRHAETPAAYAPPPRVVRHCEECAFWEAVDGRLGICKRYPKKVHPTGTKFGKMVAVPGEYRRASARRVACIKGFLARVEKKTEEETEC